MTARTDALARLLEDHDTGNDGTQSWLIHSRTRQGLANAGFITSTFNKSAMRIVKLTPTGLAAARAARRKRETQ